MLALRHLAAVFFLLALANPATAADPKREALWAAVRSGEVKAVREALEHGADANARNEYGVSALWIAADKGKYEVVEYLVQKGADVNARDDIWYQTPLSTAVSRSQVKTAQLLIKSGAKDVDAAFLSAAGGGDTAMMRAILDLSVIAPETLAAALFAAGGKKEVKELLEKAGAKPLPPAPETDRKAWAALAGTYESDGGQKMTIELKDIGPVVYGRVLKPTGPDTFVPVGPSGLSFRVVRKNGSVASITMRRFTAEYGFYRFKEPVAKPVPPATAAGGKVVAPLNWPSFRGPDGTGVADGQHPPVAWDVKTGDGVRWKTAIPGLGHSCPVVWGDRVFVTTAVSSGQADPKVKIGNYGAVDSVDDTSKHTWQVICLDRDTGTVLWSRTAFEGVPKIKRHIKGSQANCTPATDGRHVVACFGSEGLYCYDFDGRLIWKRDLIPNLVEGYPSPTSGGSPWTAYQLSTTCGRGRSPGDTGPARTGPRRPAGRSSGSSPARTSRCPPGERPGPSG